MITSRVRVTLFSLGKLADDRKPLAVPPRASGAPVKVEERRHASLLTAPSPPSMSRGVNSRLPALQEYTGRRKAARQPTTRGTGGGQSRKSSPFTATPPGEERGGNSRHDPKALARMRWLPRCRRRRSPNAAPVSSCRPFSFFPSRAVLRTNKRSHVSTVEHESTTSTPSPRPRIWRMKPPVNRAVSAPS